VRDREPAHGEAVTSFISGAVPAVALWVPFDVTVRQKVPNAASWSMRPRTIRRRPSSAAGPTRNDYYDKNRADHASRWCAAGSEANDYLLSKTDAALESLQKTQYTQVPLPT
jgi:NitT/TauT family transport system substrate-binding protein